MHFSGSFTYGTRPVSSCARASGGTEGHADPASFAPALVNFDCMFSFLGHRVTIPFVPVKLVSGSGPYRRDFPTTTAPAERRASILLRRNRSRRKSPPPHGPSGVPGARLPGDEGDNRLVKSLPDELRRLFLPPLRRSLRSASPLRSAGSSPKSSRTSTNDSPMIGSPPMPTQVDWPKPRPGKSGPPPHRSAFRCGR